MGIQPLPRSSLLTSPSLQGLGHLAPHSFQVMLRAPALATGLAFCAGFLAGRFTALALGPFAGRFTTIAPSP